MFLTPLSSKEQHSGLELLNPFSSPTALGVHFVMEMGASGQLLLGSGAETMVAWERGYRDLKWASSSVGLEEGEEQIDRKQK